MWEKLLQLLDLTGGKRVLVVGDYMIDRYLYGDAERISPEAPVPVLRVVRQEDALGGAGSVVADIAALGATAHCVGLVGEDADGAILCDRLTQIGADVTGLARMQGRPTTRKTRLIGVAQHRHRQQLMRIDDESTLPLDDGSADLLLRHVERALDQCDAVCIEDYNKGVVTQRLAQGIIHMALAAGKAVLVDPASIDDYKRYAGATVMTPNRNETSKACGIRLPNVTAVRSHARDILACCHTQHVCVTLDAEGCALIGPNDYFEHVPTRTRDVYDVTGAGDEVLAAMAVTMAAGGSLLEAAYIANLAGGLEVEKFGCVPITRDEVIGEILLEHHRSLGKVRTLEQLLPELSRLAARGKTIAFTNGCFDLLHAGHVSTFQTAKQHGDILVVGVNSDASVRGLGKGGERPIVPEADRAWVLAALADVDYVIIFDEPTPQNLIEAILPNVLIKGQDWADKKVVGQDIVEKAGGKVVLVPTVEGWSTTGLVDRIRGLN